MSDPMDIRHAEAVDDCNRELRIVPRTDTGKIEWLIGQVALLQVKHGTVVGALDIVNERLRRLEERI